MLRKEQYLRNKFPLFESNTSNGSTLEEMHFMGNKKRRPCSSTSTICYCGKIDVMSTSWKDLNPGRRFFGCVNYEGNGACGFFEWFDPLMCERAIVVIPGLLRKLRKMEEAAKQNRCREQAMCLLLLVICILFLALMVRVIW